MDVITPKMDSETAMLQTRRSKEKRARYESHMDFLESCIKISEVPVGFNIGWQAEVDMDKELLDKCTRIKKDASIKLMEMAQEACSRKIATLSEDITGLEASALSGTIFLTDNFEKQEKLKMKDVKERKMKKLIQDTHNSFDLVKVKGDGNCFYRCLGRYLYDDEEQHSVIRKELTSYMSQNKNRFEHLIDEPIVEHIQNQLHTDGSVRSWATEAEIYAASAKYCVNVKVTDSFGKLIKWQTHTMRINNDITEETDIPYNESIHLLLKGSHFDLVLKSAAKSGDVRKLNFVKHNAEKSIDWFDLEKMAADNNTVTSNSNTENAPNNENTTAYTAEPVVDIDSHRKSEGENHECAQKEAMQSIRTDKYNNDPNKAVTNLSRYRLKDSEISLLAKGLKFIPDRAKVNKIKLLADLGEWERRMRLREYSYEKEDTGKREEDLNEKFVVRKKSTFTPSKGRDPWLDLYIELVKNDIVNSLKTSARLNISKEEQSAFQSLLNNSDIIIRPADKGSGVVILNADEYTEKLYQEMTDTSSYAEDTSGCTIDSLRKVKKLVNRMYRDGAISKDMSQYLIPRYSHAGTLKGNPKLHKKDIPLRTIVNGINTPTERLAEVSEYELNNFVTETPSYIRDTTDFINKLNDVKAQIPHGAILFCFDVRKLYPSVPRKEGMEACKEALMNRKKSLVPTEEVLEMIETVLDNNNFHLGDKYFKQTDGIAIGSRLGKNFACAYMRKWDEKLLDFGETPMFYKRFIDDGFGVWLGSVEGLEAFANHSNSIHENIKVDLRWSREKIEFLDTWVKNDDGGVYTDLYIKPTDRQLYIHNKSCHPSHTKKALAYGLGVRMRRICEKEEDYRKNRDRLKRQLRKRGYSGKHVETQLQRVDRKTRTELLETNKDKKHTERVPLVLTYSKGLPIVSNIVRKHRNVLERSERMKEVFKDPPLVAFRRDKNLCDSLVHAKTNRITNKPTEKCDCKICNIIIEGSIRDVQETKVFRTAEQIQCSDRNLVYGLFCARCEVMVYVGETERTLKERTTEHLRTIRLEEEKPINRHFGNHTEGDLRVTVLQRVGTEGRMYRQLIEDIWIKKLGTKLPYGCNTKY